MRSYAFLGVSTLPFALAASALGCATVGADLDFDADPRSSVVFESNASREPRCFAGYPAEMRASPPPGAFRGCPDVSGTPQRDAPTSHTANVRPSVSAGSRERAR
jgi:hypothetical protein